MLKKKYNTSPLFERHESMPIVIKEPKKPSRFRALQLLWSFVICFWQAKFGYGRGDLVKKAIIWRKFFEDLGGLWVKVGQLVAMRTDLFDKEFTTELSNLHYQVAGFPFSYARERIEKSLGTNLEQVFVNLDKNPLAAASMAQVHLGKLRHNGEEVVVKVLRPYARELLEKDMALFKRFFSFLHQFKRFKTFLLKDMAWELGNMLKEEVDFRYEIDNLVDSKKKFREYNIYIPKVYKQYSSDQVIIMEYIRGITMAEYIKAYKEAPDRLKKWIKENKIKPKKVSRHLLRTAWDQTMGKNYFHGDLQPGNIILLRKNRVAFIDLGSVGSTDAESLRYVRQYFACIAERRYKKAADYSMLLAPYIPSEHRNQINKNMVRAIRSSLSKASLTQEEIETRSTIHYTPDETLKELTKHDIPPNWSLLKINRVFLTLDPTIIYLYPKINVEKEWTEYFEEEQSKGGLKHQLNQLSDLRKSINNTSRVFSKIVTRNAMEVSDRVSKTIQIGLYLLGLLKWVLSAFFLLVLWTYLYHHHEVIDHYHEKYNNWFFRWVEQLPSFPKIYFYAVKVIILVLLWRYYLFMKNLSASKNR